jgi:hypothetical protein
MSHEQRRIHDINNCDILMIWKITGILLAFVVILEIFISQNYLFIM